MTENINNKSFQVNEDESSIQLSDLWNMIWDHKWWYVISLFICLCGAAFYLYHTPELYTRSAKVIIDESDQDATMRNLGVASAGMMRLRSFNSVENEMEALASPDLMQTVVQRLNLQTRYVDQQFLRNVEFYHNSPVELILAGDNPQNVFSFTVSNKENGKIEL